MSVIENFAALSAQEQLEFATALVKTLNTEKTFSDVEFKVYSVEANDMTGGLMIELSHEGTVEVPRDAFWTCSDSDDAGSPEDEEFENFIWDDAKKVFKTFSAEVEGYSVKLDVSDADAENTVSVEVDDLSHEDSGIGSYEYWGETGYDSHPYCEVRGTITQACTIYPALFVEAADTIPEETEED